LESPSLAATIMECSVVHWCSKMTMPGLLWPSHMIHHQYTLPLSHLDWKWRWQDHPKGLLLKSPSLQAIIMECSVVHRCSKMTMPRLLWPSHMIHHQYTLPLSHLDWKWRWQDHPKGLVLKSPSLAAMIMECSVVHWCSKMTMPGLLWPSHMIHHQYTLPLSHLDWKWR
jgi:hypothetical protein